MIDIGGVTDWRRVGAKDVLTFDAENPRPVTLMVNTAGPVAIYVREVGATEEDDAFLIGLVTGLEKLKFEVPGPYEVFHVVDNVDVFMRLGDGAVLHRENLDEETFTRLHQERVIDPVVQHLLERMEMRHRAESHELRKEIGGLNARLRNERPADVGTPDPQQDDDGDASVDPAAPPAPVVPDNSGQ